MASVFDTLKERGLVADCTAREVPELLSRERLVIYCGFDPTADSLHLGHLVPIMALSHLQRAGHKVLLVIGGATGMIGDPSGRSSERNLLTPEEVRRNAEAIKVQMARLLDFGGPNPAKLLNNYDWIGPMTFIEWLRDVGKHFSLASMLAKESVRLRLESETGISFTEFSYMTLQAYDFLHLYDAEGCTLQVGGNDQWGNITAGIDLIRKVRGGQAYGLTFPLVTTASGEKFGKSAGNAIWLDQRRTTPWDFYQYLVRQDDRDVIRLLKLYTFLPLDEIAELEQRMARDPERREAQRALAFEVTRMIHTEATAQEVARAAEVIYYSEIKDLSDDLLMSVFSDVPRVEVTLAELEAGIDILDLLIRAGLASSRGEARRLIRGGGVYMNNVRLESEGRVTEVNLASPSFIVLRAGKRRQCLVHVSK